LPKCRTNVSYLGYPIIVKKGNVVKIRHELEKRGIENRPLFGYIPNFPIFKSKIRDRSLPNAEYIGKYGFYIGCHQYLETEDLEYIYKQFKDILK